MVLADNGHVAADDGSDPPASLGTRIHKFDTKTVAAVYANAGGINVDCPGKDEASDSILGEYELVIDEAMLTDMNNFLAAGGTVEIRFQSEGSIITLGAGSANYTPNIYMGCFGGCDWRKRLSERVFGPGGQGPLTQEGIKHPYTIPLTSDAVNQLQPGSTFSILASAFAEADSGGCKSEDQAIAMWELKGMDGTAAPDRPALFMEE